MNNEGFYLGWYTTHEINYLILKIKEEEIANVLLEDVTMVE